MGAQAPRLERPRRGSRLAAGGSVAWLDVCSGSRKALFEAAETVRDEGIEVELVGVDPVGMSEPHDPFLIRPRLVEAS